MFAQGVGSWDAGEYVGFVYRERMRTATDKQRVNDAFTKVFGKNNAPYSSKVSRIVTHTIHTSKCVL